MGTPSGEIRAGLFVFLYIGRQYGSGQHSDEDAKCGRKSGDDRSAVAIFIGMSTSLNHAARALAL
jgi:hypothetical protein